MTATKKTKRTGLKTLFILLLSFLLCFAGAFGIACNNAETEEDDTNYTKNETDEQIIANGNFEFKTSDSKPTSFPIYTGISWSRATDNASSSAVNSGIVDTDDFDTWFDTLYSDPDFVSYLKRCYADEIEALGEDADDDAVKSALKEAFGNPGVSDAHQDDDESKILMINNYVASFPGYGTAQRFTSSSTVTMERGSYGKLSVWVKTKNLSSKLVGSDEYGANIKLTNTIAGTTQAEYRLTGIRTEEWTEYTVYVKANDFMATTLKVVLGLGYGTGTSSVENNVEGTAYFDDVVYEEISKEEYDAGVAGATVSEVSPEFKNSEDTLDVYTADKTVFAYDMSTASFFRNANVTAEGQYVTSAQGVSGGRYDTDKSTKATVGTVAELVDGYDALPFMDPAAKALKIDANYASYEVKLGQVTLAPNSYYILSFYLKTDLAFNTTGLSFYAIDVDPANSANNVTNTVLSSVVTEKVDETLTPEDDDYDILRGWKRYTVILKNNYTEGDDRVCELILNFGPTDVNQTDKNLFAKGTATLANFVEASGEIPSSEEKEYKNYTEEDHIYSMINSTADSTNVFAYALYAGYTEDYTEEDDPTYNMTIAPSNEGVETSRPATPKDFLGVEGGSVYVSNDEDAPASDVNKNGNAGIVNTKYLDNYTNFPGIADFFADEEDPVQPLMIYNPESAAYGYLAGTNELAADSFTVITVRVKVTGSAVAYVYVTDASNDHETRASVLTQYDSDRKLAVKVTADMMNEDGWATVSIYFSAGKDAINYRVELWNGSRDAQEKSVGYVFFDDYAVTSSDESGFTSAFDTANNEGYIEDKDFIRHTTTLTEEEIEYNEKYHKDNDTEEDYFKPRTDVVWAQTTDVIEGNLYLFVRNDTLNRSDPVIPDDSETDSGDDSGSGCQSVDQSTFWLSLSSIILAVALVAAIVALIVKRVAAKRRRNASDATAHYDVKSRNKTHEFISQRKVTAPKVQKAETPEAPEAPAEETTDEPAEEYQYGEVLEDFGDTAAEETDEPDSSEENKDEE